LFFGFSFFYRSGNGFCLGGGGYELETPRKKS